MLKVVLAHDSFTQSGGAERVAFGLHRIFPHALIYTLCVDQSQRKSLEGIDLRVSPLQWCYSVVAKFQYWFFLVPVVLRFWKPNQSADVLLSSSSAYLKGLQKPRGAYHINYCHTPTRFLWSDLNYALAELPRVLRPLARVYLAWLKHWDLRQANKVDFFIANSKEVQSRITKYYNRDSEVIYPFIDTRFWQPTIPKNNYFLIAGRLAPYKMHDQVIKIFNELGLPLHVVGTGRNLAYLQSLAGSNVTFLGHLTDEQLRDEYSGAQAFIYPQLEDFGLMPLEAAACGTPTIGLNAGGSLETIVHDRTGVLVNMASSNELQQAVVNFKPGQFAEAELIRHAQQFSEHNFKEHILAFVKKVTGKEMV